ncbi:MAG TPA: aminoglycoside phosphotransferase family protein [Gaiellaceae bacterium]|nr:aminoglycoside phosphotransferase family protein [Gaiellaceae bacterium]
MSSDRPDLASTAALAEQAAAEWGLELGAPFAPARYSYVAPAGDDAVVKVAWEGDDESLHEADALERWQGGGAVRLLRRSGRVLLEERARPGDDISGLPDEEAMAIAVELGLKLWRPAGEPFRFVGDQVPRWLENAARTGDSDAALLALALELWSSLEWGRGFLVHGDFHHHNILRHGNRHVAIDPKPYLAEREYDVPTMLWNPLSYQMTDRVETERRIAAFVAAGLDDFKIRAWTVIRGAYLGHTLAEAELIRSLV